MMKLRVIEGSLARVQAIVRHAVTLPAATRDAYVAQEAHGDAPLREQVQRLLAQTDNGPGSRGVNEESAQPPIDKRAALVGRTIGRYKLVAVLGQGGAGVVYLGERADRQYSAQVACKVVDQTAVSGSLGIRFRAERQILASLNHPNIARLVDAGETPEGQPYLVMEYVHGVSVDRYCDQHQLDLRARLHLFLDICAAVQYAHQNLIVHRDLKPGNVLVTEDGVPKLLDFGIAKLLDASDITEMRDLTRYNERLLTPEYASPEQIMGRTVTTASDVYSLGVVLYQLLCGLRSYKVSSAASQLELERSICVTDPDRPSVAVARARVTEPPEGESNIHSLALARATSPERLQRQLIGDLDAIIMRALRKEPEHRYSSVEQLALDIRRHLAHEVVQARQGHWLYHSQRFIRRHKVGVAMGAGFAFFAVGVAIVMSLQSQRIAAEAAQKVEERNTAVAVTDFMLKVFTSVDPFQNSGKEPSARDLLGEARLLVYTNLGEQPALRANQMELIGKAYRRLGLPEQAVPLLQDALRIVRERHPINSPASDSLVIELAIALRDAGRFDDSDPYFTEALQSLRLAKQEHSEEFAKRLVEVGRLEAERSNVPEARKYFTQALHLMRELKGSMDPEVGSILSQLANLADWSGDLVGAEQMARQAVDIYRSVKEHHPDRIKADYHLAEILLHQGRFSDAAPIFEKTLSAQRQIYKKPNGIVADTLASLARVRLGEHNAAEAEKLASEALAIHDSGDSTASLKIGYLKALLASIAMEESKFAEAENLLRAALDLFARDLPPDHQYVASAEHHLGEAMAASGQLADAEAALTSAMNRWKRTDAPAWRSARSQSALGEVLYRAGRPKDAERHLVASYRVLIEDPGVEQETLVKARARVERYFADQNRRLELDALMRETRRVPTPATETQDPRAINIKKTAH